MNLKSVKKAAEGTVAFMTSPRFVAILGVCVAAMQFVGSIQEMRSSSKGRKTIGFDKG
jgi:hypothetical protein